MRHRLKRWRLASSTKKRKMLVKNLCTELITRESIRTTFRQAQYTARQVDRLITLAKMRTLTARRKISDALYTEYAAKKLFWHLWKRYETRFGGYTRVLRTHQRKSDSAKLAVVELVDSPATILTAEDLLRRQDKVERAAGRRCGLGTLGLAVALPPRPGTPQQSVLLQTMIKRHADKSAPSVSSERVQADPLETVSSRSD
eukprot:Plantae.Rhodophyta-Purpureofilum_apyrenoidigerum.ctg19473.p2 GENE.Plantae.Rhodophyta-Purpureofilum_apyrenoidigerum.ctg19473~~Plantae.Rhodophyta-Purpureofilum_apyrenoidigerum.ctg19473.p2  ORF type:complete len:201 (-),score=17.91 Plantae.Rhodophyta-Purpureofilum_apyrenoidigerum.ctg19473:342-944(-)